MRAILLGLVFFNLTACEDKTQYESQLVFKNSSDKIMEIQLFPKNENFGHYPSSPNTKNGVFFYSNFKLQSGEEKVIFEGAGEKEQPYNIFTKYFNKFAYKQQIQDDSSFVFIASTSNFHTIFNTASLWKYEKRMIGHPTMFKKNSLILNTYIYDIKE